MSFVLDSSVALAMLLPDEQSAAADSIAELLVRTTARVPAIWQLEVRNALLVALRARRLSSREFEERMSLLDELAIEVDFGADHDVLARTVDIARRQDLSAYDAAYVELARRLGIPLATFDARLRKACLSLKLSVMP